ncbi:glycosyltransferase family 2 protein [Paracoccus sp. IB05]|uniref:glycosyltransferase family 2 protein n=1 Tax=Paracoccus sp. IB05 TaxID=2779367 RepID=UPI0018E860B0|nr:glycosyltransferase family 2 protein [Paracoccus sp. IB05]MBJ2150319.1 glycosyltransferase [Paracoccus sp. IB05]
MTDRPARPPYVSPRRDRAPVTVPQGRNGFAVSLFSRRQRVIYLTLCLLWALAVAWFWIWWLDPAHFVGWVPFLFATIPLLWIQWLQVFFVVVLLMAARSAAPDPQPGQWRVAMIVTKTPSEPFCILRRTLEAMLAQDYPHHTWLADEDPSPETRAWCAAHGVHISTRKGFPAYHQPVWPRRTRCKEGNLAFFYDHWGYDNYDIVAQLDADHVPQPGYLREMVRPFADPQVGYVSAPSICAANATESWAARTRLHTEAAFHGLFQMGYTRLFTPMCIGSHYAVRTRALRQVGGLGPELAEDHSTTMLLSAGGWRGVHAIDAIAIGDGPASVTDLVTQEFQWSRSLLSLLLQHSGRYLPKLSPRLRFLFVFCQLWYPLFALTALMMYLAPMVALAFDMRFANVTYPGFLLHAVPPVIVLLLIALRIRHDGFFRPVDAPVISWEKALFLAMQWPWALWGCAMAVRDRLTGSFVDFRITPKGEAAARTLPLKVLAVYTLLALGATLPVLFSAELANARGFLLLALLNAALYTALVVVIVWHHLRETGAIRHQSGLSTLGQTAAAGVVLATVALGFSWRGVESMHALAFGLEPLRLVRAEYGIAGAGYGANDRIYFIWDPGWITR